MTGSPSGDRLSDYSFSFPPEAVALRPAPKGSSRILRVSLDGGERRIIRAQDMLQEFRPGDCLVVNNTKVIPARLLGQRPSGGKLEALLLRPASLPTASSGLVQWEAMVKPGRYFQTGDTVLLGGLPCQVQAVLPGGERILAFPLGADEFSAWLEAHGHVPLPPYIKREDDSKDRQDYQAVFAENPGAVAAPTASLHFDEALVEALKAKGVLFVSVTLHVGAGTFRNIEAENYQQHEMHAEWFRISAESAQAINQARQRGGRIVAIGTTAARVLETAAQPDGTLVAQEGETRIFLYPGYRWKACHGLLTNFHWPRSSLVLLVASLRGKENVLDDYRYAISNGFRLFSYGDGMLLL